MRLVCPMNYLQIIQPQLQDYSNQQIVFRMLIAHSIPQLLGQFNMKLKEQRLRRKNAIEMETKVHKCE